LIAPSSIALGSRRAAVAVGAEGSPEPCQSLPATTEHVI
jgi:hypothetical protein